MYAFLVLLWSDSERTWLRELFILVMWGSTGLNTWASAIGKDDCFIQI